MKCNVEIALISIYTGGTLSLAVAIFHTRFFSFFRWKREFERITTINKNILYTIHLALLMLFFGFAALTFLYAEELSGCAGMALGINVLLSLFWLWRAIWQVVYFKPGRRGRLLLLHFLLFAIFLLLFVCYSIPLLTRYI